MNISEGDWVRFRRDGRLVIGVVSYIKTHRYTHEKVIETDIGAIEFNDVMEVRKRGDANDTA